MTFEDPEQKEFELKMSKTIDTMPAEVKDRFKALKVLYVSHPKCLISMLSPKQMIKPFFLRQCLLMTIPNRINKWKSMKKKRNYTEN